MTGVVRLLNENLSIPECRTGFPSKLIFSLMTVKRIFRRTSCSTIWITCPRLRPRRDSSLTTRRSPAVSESSNFSMRSWCRTFREETCNSMNQLRQNAFFGVLEYGQFLIGEVL